MEGTIFLPSAQKRKDKEFVQATLPLFMWRRKIQAKKHVDLQDVLDIIDGFDYLEANIRHEITVSFVSSPPGSKGKITKEEARSLLMTTAGDAHQAQLQAGSFVDRRE